MPGAARERSSRGTECHPAARNDGLRARGRAHATNVGDAVRPYSCRAPRPALESPDVPSAVSPPVVNQALLDHFAEQAGFCDAYGSPFTARLLEAMARDLRDGGPTADLVGSWRGAPRADAVALRVAGALHAAALSGRDAALAAEYPAARPHWDADAVWRAARAFLLRERSWVAEFIRSAPQTNEVRRAIGLLVGFLHLAARFRLPVDTLEIGASAGLNLYWDRFAYRTDAWSWGTAETPLIETAWTGPPPPVDAPLGVRSRAACDLRPPDVTDPEARLRLRAYIWADQAERLARFDTAAAIALAHRVHVERADAATWLEERLARRAPDALTVVYHSVFYQYPPRDVRERIRDVIATAGTASAAPLAWLRLEPEAALDGPRDSVRFLIDVVTWPGGERRTLATTDGHVRFIAAEPAA